MSAAAPRRTEGLLAAALIVAAAVPLHVGLALGTDLSPDEAYYLSAARRGGLVPDLVDHPPLLPWLLRLGDHLAGPLELRVRLWAILFSGATGLAVAALARRFGAKREGILIAAWVGSWALLPTAGGFITTPDGAALLAVAVALLAAGGERRPRNVAIAAAALFVGALAKVVVLPIALGLALAELWPAGIDRRVAGARAAALLAGPALALPLLGPSLRFQLRHAFTQTATAGWSPALAASALLAAASAQALLWSPPVLWLGARALRRVPIGPRLVALGLSALVAVSAVARGVPPEPNWWAPAALVVIAAAALGADALTTRARRAVLLAVVAPTLIAAAHTAWPFLPLRRTADPTARLHGWRRGPEPMNAPGIGAYGPAAERCVYHDDCSQIDSYFNEMDAHP